VSPGLERPPTWAIIAMLVGVAAIAVLTPLAWGRGELSPAEIERIESRIAAERPEPSAGPEAPPVRAAFLGDSYTVGVGDDDEGGYVRPVAERFGWEALVFGQTGTGYVDPGDVDPGSVPYPDRIPEVIAAEPDVVVVQGSTNDARRPEDVQAAALELFTALREGLPETQIVAVGPVLPPIESSGDVRRVTEAVAAAAAAAGVPFLDPVAEEWLPFQREALYDGDLLHPSPAGYDQFADRLGDRLGEILPAP
jgi:acyl-CoA thioesterase-1